MKKRHGIMAFFVFVLALFQRKSMGSTGVFCCIALIASEFDVSRVKPHYKHPKQALSS
jgi:hypothetical protein